MSGMDGSVEEINGTEVDSESFLRFSPTSVSTGAAAAYGRTASVYVYVSIFLSLLLFLLTLLIIALHRLKNIISSSSSYPECGSEAGSSFTNMEICSISSQRSTVSSLS
uniref:Serine rich and transmembrane domain containing 1 n=1 Tax=Sinocyclocheilus anshuiensis TaxID=1608454 RepID=A0A671RVU1_9TELE